MVISVSVVVPVYSGEAYLERLIKQLEIVRSDWIDRKSVLSLAEVILVDDSGVDGSPAEVADLSQKQKISVYGSLVPPLAYPVAFGSTARGSFFSWDDGNMERMLSYMSVIGTKISSAWGGHSPRH